MGETEIARRHALDPLSAPEVAAAVRILRIRGPASAGFRFVSVNLQEPPKAELLNGQVGDRRAFIIVIDLEARRVLEALVSLRDEMLLACEERRGVQPGIIIEEFMMCEQAVKADPQWRAALLRRGITEFEKAIVDPWSAGAYGDERFPERRLAQGLTWIRGSDGDVGYGRPVEGLITFVDLEKMEVVEVIDDVQVPLPPLSGLYTAETVGPLRGFEAARNCASGGSELQRRRLRRAVAKMAFPGGLYFARRARIASPRLRG